MTKYKRYFENMVSENKTIFDSFRLLHSKFEGDQAKFQDEFNLEGERVLAIVNEWENKLCSQSEKAGYGSFVGNLSEKFRKELKSQFPLIDHIGVISTPFILKQIKL